MYQYICLGQVQMCVAGKLHICTVSTTVAPTIVNTVINKTISALEGSSVTLQFQIINANPSVTTNQIQWYFNNTLAIKHRTILYENILVFTSDLRSLTISSINYDITGRISITAQNTVGSDSDYIDLVIEGLLEYY